MHSQPVCMSNGNHIYRSAPATLIGVDVMAGKGGPYKAQRRLPPEYSYISDTRCRSLRSTILNSKHCKLWPLMQE